MRKLIIITLSLIVNLCYAQSSATTGIIASGYRAPSGGGHIVWLNCTNAANTTALAHWNNVGIDITAADFIDILGVNTGWRVAFPGDQRVDTDTYSPPSPTDPIWPDDVARANWTLGPGINVPFNITGLNNSKTYDITVYVYDGTGNNNSSVTIGGNTQVLNANVPTTFKYTSLTPSSGIISASFIGTTGGDYGTLTAMIIEEK